jgi:Abnormal spindle-like microcephaly-assoc'd, ASPM-SPD-2-Hydin
MGSSSRRYCAFAFLGAALALCAFFVFSKTRNSSQLAAPRRVATDARLAAAKLSSEAAGRFLQQEHSYFERNAGQVDGEVQYLSHGKDYSLFLTRTGATVVLPDTGAKSAASQQQPYFRLKFQGANPEAEVAGVEKLPGTSSYFAGPDPKLWHTRIPQFGRVRYSNLYPGVDVIFYFHDGQLEYDVLAAPGADPRIVRLKVERASAHLTSDGDVSIKLGPREVVRLRKPHTYQDGETGRVVETKYSIARREISFALGAYDPRRAVTIDPALIFASVVTSNCIPFQPSVGPCDDEINDLAADNTGVYLTGSTQATVFPATAGGGTSTLTTQNNQTFITKIDPTGAHVLYTAFLANSGGSAIAVDASGAAYVTGGAGTNVAAGQAAFPLTQGVFSGAIPSDAPGGDGAMYAAKISVDGSTIAYSTLLQQPNGAPPTSIFQLVSPSKIAVNSQGAVYVAGTTTQNTINRSQSVFNGLPVTIGAFQTTPGSNFVLKLNANATGLDYATYIDGNSTTSSSSPAPVGLQVDGSGDAFVAGNTRDVNFPTTPGAYQQSGGAFVMELNPTGTAQIYSTRLGDDMSVAGMGIDAQGRAVLTGSAGSLGGTGNVPVTPGAFCGNVTSSLGSFQGVVMKLKADGSGIVYATTLCGPDAAGSSVAVDPTGAAYVVGTTDYPSTFQPVLLNPIQAYVPTSDVFMNIAVKLDNSGTLQWATFLGTNTSGSEGQKITVDATGAAYVLADSDIPQTANAFGPPNVQPGVSNGAGVQNFLMKLAPTLGAAVPLVNRRLVAFANQNVGLASAAADVQVGNFGDVPMSPTVSITGDFSETDNCSVGVAPGQKCDVNVIFTPSVTGPRTGVLTVAFGGSIASQTVVLNGNAAAPQVTLSPTSLTFGVQAVGTTSGAQQVTVTNSGTGTLTVSSVQASAPFAATNTCGAPIAPGNNCTIQVTFTPTSDSVQTGTLTIVNNASVNPQTVALSGNVQSTGGGGGTGGGGMGGGGTGGGGTGGGGTGTPPGIGLGAPTGDSTSATVTAGSTATYGLSIGGAGISGTASLSCTGAPTGAACSVPNSVTLSATTPSTFNVSVTTTAHAGVWPTQFERPLLWLWPLATLGCLTLLVAFSAARPVRMRWRFVPAFALILCACGGGGSPAPTNPTPSGNSTTAGTYTIVVTAKSGSTTQSQNLTLVVK